MNTASQCGFTPQYKDLEALYEKYKDEGFEILAFPANEFGKQEPGSNEEIKEFCSTKYKVSFPLFSKIVVKGEGIDPLYDYLTSKETNPKFAGEIQWNFNMFLVNRKGEVIARFKPRTNPSPKKSTPRSKRPWPKSDRSPPMRPISPELATQHGYLRSAQLIARRADCVSRRSRPMLTPHLGSQLPLSSLASSGILGSS